MYIELLIVFILIFINAFFAASEMALITLNDNKIKVMAEEGHKKAILLQKLLSEPSGFLATIQIGITLAGFLASAFAGERFASPVAKFLYDAGVPLSVSILETLSLILITLILSYFTLVLGELVPKRIAMQKAEPIAMLAATPLAILSKITLPMVKLLTASTNVIVRLVGVDPNASKEEVTEEEIRMMVDVGEENGSIRQAEKIMINNIFELNNITVSEILTHRTNTVCVSKDIPLQELVAFVHSQRFSRFPVFEDDVDNIIGILHVKDLFKYLQSDYEGQFELSKMVRSPYFVHESKHADELLTDLQKRKVHLAIVIDEYGGMSGIITIEDLLEEIVGSIQDEYDDEDKESEMIDMNTFIFSGTVALRTVKEQLHVELPTDVYDTLSGFIIGELGALPKNGEQPIFEYEGVEYRVEIIKNKRIGKVKATKLV